MTSRTEPSGPVGSEPARLLVLDELPYLLGHSPGSVLR